MQQLSTLRIEMMRLLCGFAEQFSATDLYRNATSFRSHRFLRTAFKIQREAERSPIHYCRCGELAFKMAQQAISLVSLPTISAGTLQLAS
jgi:hypothetical protein